MTGDRLDTAVDGVTADDASASPDADPKRSGGALHVLIVASDTGGALAPLDERHDLALLPLAGKPVLEHVIESVVRLAPAHVTVAASRDLRGVRALVRDGTRWGVPMHTVSVRVNEPAVDIVARERSLRREDLLVVEVDRIVDGPLDALLGVLRERALADGADVSPDAAGVARAARALFDPRTSLRWFPRGTDAGDVRETTPLEATVHRIDSLGAYHALSLAAARGEIASLTLRGRERAPGLTAGFASRLSPGSLVSGTAFAGVRCRVHGSCRFSGTVVLNHGVAIDRGTDVRDSVVLDDTYLGERLSVHDAIVAGDTVIRVDTGAVLKLTDRFLVSDLDRSIYDEHFGHASHRLAGLALLALSLPLWPLAYACALGSRSRTADASGKETGDDVDEPVAELPRRLLHRERRVGNLRVPGSGRPRVFTTFRFAAGPRALRRLPLLSAVAAGHIRLIGVTPLTPPECEAREAGWQRARDGAPVGLIGPTQLHLGLDAPLEQRLFSDAVFVGSGRTLPGSLGLLGRALHRLVVPRANVGDERWIVDLLSD